MTALHTFADEQEPALRLAHELGLDLGIVRTHRFPDGELLPVAPPTEATTIVYRSLYDPNEKLIELVLAVESWRRNGAKKLILVAPYLAYMRQDIAFEPGEAVSQRAVASLLDSLFDRIITVDPHLHRTAHLKDLFPTSECTHLHSAQPLADHMRKTPFPHDLLVVGPDSESAPWVRRIAALLGREFTVMTKKRLGDTHVALSAPDDVNFYHRPILIVDDICSSGGTLRAITKTLKAKGAASVSIFITHALFSEETSADLVKSGADRILSSDSCLHASNAVHLAPILALALGDASRNQANGG